MEKEKIKVSFSAVVLIIAILIVIICCLSYKVASLSEQLGYDEEAELEKKYVKGLTPGLAESNDYGLFGENYLKSLNLLLEPSSGLKIYADPSIYVEAQEPDKLTISAIEIDQNGDAYAKIPKGSPLYDKYGKTTKVASKVIDAAICHEGNGDLYNIYLIKTDGRVLKLSDSNGRTGSGFSGELITEEIEAFSDIIKIFSVNINGNDRTIFVDINGNLLDSNGKGIE